jgi:spore germination cell wall hydrolase CwlJ-like protein
MTYGEKITADELSSRTGLDLLARVIYGESEMGKRAVAHVINNRALHSNTTLFGGPTYKGVILKENQFSSMQSSRVLEPDISSQAWKDCLDIALNMDTAVNPILTCLWFVTNNYYKNHSSTKNGVE